MAIAFFVTLGLLSMLVLYLGCILLFGLAVEQLIFYTTGERGRG
jgi:hypothetical protein